MRGQHSRLLRVARSSLPVPSAKDTSIGQELSGDKPCFRFPIGHKQVLKP